MNESVAYFNEKFKKVLNTLAPTKEKRVKAKVKPAWFTHDISQAIMLRDQQKKNGNHIEYKTHRNKVTNLIKRSKQNYYKKGIEESKGNSKKLWSYMKVIQDHVLKEYPKLLNIDGISVTDPKRLSNELNKHFVNIAKKVNSDLPHNVTYEPPVSLTS